jgi:hypothetical protein
MAVGLALAGMIAPQAAKADATNGTLYFTTFSGGNNVNKISYNYNGSGTFTLGSIVNIAMVTGADGIVFNPNNGKLLVGGQGNVVHEIDPTTGTSVDKTPGVNAFHLSVNASGNAVYAASIPGTASKMGLTPGLQNGTVQTMAGMDTAVDTMVFTDDSDGYYTDSGSGGGGNFGTFSISGSTITTSRKIAGGTATHGMALDAFTGDIFTMGGSQICQISQAALTVFKSCLTIAGRNFDQGSVDGKGHLFAADNNGHLVFVDYGASGLIGSGSNFVYDQFLTSSLDDIAPLSGAGAPSVPEPSSIILLSTIGLAIAGFKRRAGKTA